MVPRDRGRHAWPAVRRVFLMWCAEAIDAIVPGPANAIVVSEPRSPFAHSVVHSSGSTAMSNWKSSLVPSCSPSNSIGASSLAPSPTTVLPTPVRVRARRAWLRWLPGRRPCRSSAGRRALRHGSPPARRARGSRAAGLQSARDPAGLRLASGLRYADCHNQTIKDSI